MTTENERLRALAAISDEEVAALALDGERDLAKAIADRPRRRPFALLRGDGHGGRPPLAALAASFALVALAVAGLAVGIAGSGGSSPSGGPAGAPAGTATEGSGVEGAVDELPERLPSTTLPAATVPDEAVELVERGPEAQPPRYLLAGDGWKVTRVDEFERDGEMTFARGDTAFELSWRTGSFEEWLSDRAHGADRLSDVEVEGGQDATVFADREGRGFFTALWQAGDFTLEFRVTVVPGRSEPHLDPSARLSESEFGNALRSLRQETLRDWLAAVPETVVQLDERPQAVDAMLADVPLPPGFDTAPLLRGELVKDEYQFGATVIGTVACAWLDRWATVHRAGERAQARDAAEAMGRVAGSRVLRQMDADGDYPEVVRDLAAAVRGSGKIDQGKPAMPVEDVYPSALGCDAR